jgi:hypothetical protein
MPPYHTIVRGLCHDSRPIVLPVGGLGTPVAVCSAALCLAQPMRDGTGNASHAHHAAASTLQGAQAVCRPHPPAPLLLLCARGCRSGWGWRDWSPATRALRYSGVVALRIITVVPIILWGEDRGWRRRFDIDRSRRCDDDRGVGIGSPVRSPIRANPEEHIGAAEAMMASEATMPTEAMMPAKPMAASPPERSQVRRWPRAVPPSGR